MTFAALTNIFTMLFCGAVLVQIVRLIRCLREVQGAGFAEMVTKFDTSTIQAKQLLAELHETLLVDCAANARVIANGEAMREELNVMAGIADAAAERIVEAVGKTNRPGSEVAPASAGPSTEPMPKPAAKRAHAFADAAAERMVEAVGKTNTRPGSVVAPAGPSTKPMPKPAAKRAHAIADAAAKRVIEAVGKSNARPGSVVAPAPAGSSTMPMPKPAAKLAHAPRAMTPGIPMPAAMRADALRVTPPGMPKPAAMRAHALRVTTPRMLVPRQAAPSFRNDAPLPR